MDQEEQQLWDKKKILKQVNNTKYRLNRQAFLGRGTAGIIFQGFRLHQNKKSEVAIKQYIGCQSWGNSQDKWDQQLKFLNQNIKKSEWQKSGLLLPVYDIFEANNRWYMASQLCKYGTLNDRIKNIKQDDGKVYDFCSKLSKILKFFHQGVSRSSRGFRKQKIMHRDVKPSNIVYLNGEKDNKGYKIFLIDFGLAKIFTNDEEVQNENVGTELYKAPQISNGRYNQKVDIWGFGATLYELLNGGEKLFSSGAVSLNPKDKQKYIQRRLIELYRKMKFAKKIQLTSFWMGILRNCLAIDPKNRWSSEDLVKNLSQFESSKQNKNKNQDDEALNKMLKKINNLQIIQINFETLRMNYLQDKIFTLFQYVALHPGQISRFLLYVLLKYLCHFIMERGSKVKQKAKIVKEEKYTYFKKLIQEKRIQQIRTRSTQKIRNQIQQLKKQNQQSYNKITKLLELFPEIVSINIRQPRTLFFEFAYYSCQQIYNNATFTTVVGQMINGMADMDEYKQMFISIQQAEANNIELVSFKKLNKFLEELDSRNQRPKAAIESWKSMYKQRKQ